MLGAMAFVVSVVVGQPLVEFLRRRGLGKEISSDGPPSHSPKAGTPTMGGVLIFAIALPITLAANIVDRLSILLPLGTIVAAGLLGMVDDLRTIIGRTRTGLNKRLKVFLLTVLGLTATLVLYFALDVQNVKIPWAGEFELGPGYIPLAVLIIVFTTTAVAITDGLDGLAGGTTALASVVGATAGFLWYNSYPAQVFMGDTGALALGSSLAVVALMTGHWLLLPIIGIVFVLEGLSDIIQIGFFRLTGGKRIFKMSPLHHHFELLGWSEPQVVMRFWLLGIVGSLLGVSLASQV